MAFTDIEKMPICERIANLMTLLVVLAPLAEAIPKCRAFARASLI